MKQNKFEFNYTVYDSIDELPENERQLLKQAREVTEQAYAPYSRFQAWTIKRIGSV